MKEGSDTEETRKEGSEMDQLVIMAVQRRKREGRGKEERERERRRSTMSRGSVRETVLFESFVNNGSESEIITSFSFLPLLLDLRFEEAEVGEGTEELEE